MGARGNAGDGRAWPDVVLLLARVAVAALAVWAVVRDPQHPSAEDAQTSTPTIDSPSSTPAATTAPAASSSTSISALGDAFSLGPAGGGDGWPQQVATDLGATVSVQAEADAGYVATGASGSVFFALAKQLPAGSDVVVVFGSRGDTAEPLPAVRQRVRQTLTLVQRTHPDADVVVVGPLWTAQPAPTGSSELTQAVAEASRGVEGVTFVDPMADTPWLDASPELMMAGFPTTEGAAVLAAKVEAALQQAGVADTSSP